MVGTQITNELHFAHKNEKILILIKTFVFVKCDILAGVLHWTQKHFLHVTHYNALVIKG